MKILLATTFYPPWSFGGDGVFVARLARALAGAGHDVHVLHEAGVAKRGDEVVFRAKPVEHCFCLHGMWSSGGSELRVFS